MLIFKNKNNFMGIYGGSEVKASACNAGDLGSISGSGSSPGEGNGNPLQYSCLENPMGRGAWRLQVARVGHDLATKPCFDKMKLQLVMRF